MSKKEFKCEKCGETMSLDTSVVLTSYPEMYTCFCEKCGHIQYIYCSEQNNYKWKRIKTELCEYKQECAVAEVSNSGNQTITGNKLCVNGISVVRNERAVLTEQIAKINEQLAEKCKEIKELKEQRNDEEDFKNGYYHYWQEAKKELADKDKVIGELLEEQSLLSELNRDNIIIVKQLNDPTCYVSLEEYGQMLSKKDKEIDELKQTINTLQQNTISASVDDVNFIHELENQLAEKEKEIERLKMAFKDMRCLKNRAIKLLKDTVNELREELADQHHQICEKIRNSISEILGVDASAWDEMNDEYYTGLTICTVAQVLDRIEKGKLK